MIDVAGRFSLDRQRQRQPGERVVVAGGDPPPRRRPRLEPSELHPEQRGLEVVEAARIAERAGARGGAVTGMAEARGGSAVVTSSCPRPPPRAAAASRSAWVPAATPIA